MRAIDADELMSVPNVNKVTEYDEAGWGVSYLAVSVDTIKAAPTLKVEPVTYGTWIQDKSMAIKYPHNRVLIPVVCSECKTAGSPQWKRCPVCEVKMKDES